MTAKQIDKLDHDGAKEALVQVKADIKAKRDEFHAFLKENKLKRNVDHSEDTKHGKKFKAFKTAIDKLTEQREAISAKVKETKPKKGAGRKSKYEYPADVTTPEQKKKYRTKMRAEAKKAEKAAAKAEGGNDARKKKAKKKPAKKKEPGAAEDED